MKIDYRNIDEFDDDNNNINFKKITKKDKFRDEDKIINDKKKNKNRKKNENK